MQINLFSDSSIITRSSQPLGKLRGKDVTLIESLDHYEQLQSDDPDIQHHIDAVLYARGKENREYEEILGFYTDSHHDIEKLGTVRYRRQFTTIISLEDSLDYILHRLSGAKIENIRAIPEYKTLSRSLMKANFENLETTFDTLIGCDPMLRKYIHRLYSDAIASVEAETEVPVEERENPVELFIMTFYQKILAETSRMLEYLSFHFYFEMPKDTTIPRSKSLCSFVFTSDFKTNESVVIKSTGHDDYTIMIRSFARFEYLDNINLEYSVVG